MSDSHTPMTLTHGDGLTIEDLEAMAPDEHTGGRRFELIGGTIVVNPSPAPKHQIALGNLNELVRAACPADHTTIFAPMDLDLPGPQRVEPDLIVVPNSSIGQQRLVLPVLLLVELVSPSFGHWDLIVKRDAYAEAGVPHYWTIDTRAGREEFVAWRLEGDRYVESFRSSDTINVDEPVAISTSLADLFTP